MRAMAAPSCVAKAVVVLMRAEKPAPAASLPTAGATPAARRSARSRQNRKAFREQRQAGGPGAVQHRVGRAHQQQDYQWETCTRLISFRSQPHHARESTRALLPHRYHLLIDKFSSCSLPPAASLVQRLPGSTGTPSKVASACVAMEGTGLSPRTSFPSSLPPVAHSRPLSCSLSCVICVRAS